MKRNYSPPASLWLAVRQIMEPVIQNTNNTQFDMRRGLSSSYVPECQTVLCVGGWWALANRLKDGMIGVYDYMAGAEDLSQFLGFDDRRDLAQWARENPGIWGNSEGSNMFSTREAYTNKKNPAENDIKSMKQVDEHWELVYENSVKAGL